MSTGDLPAGHFSPELPTGIGRPADAALVARGVRTLDEVAAMTERELLDIHGVGPKAARVLRAALEASGRSLAG